jgi:hypothetical protein
MFENRILYAREKETTTLALKNANVLTEHTE